MAKHLEPSDELDGGKYKIVRLLGEGGMGTVFEAEQRETQKRVAIKCMHPHQAGDPELTERLLREARAMARVRHPNVVDIYDVGRDGATVYLVMEYLEGETLACAIARNDLPPYLALSLLIEAMRGVAAAHGQGIIHRDIKPENIFLAQVADAPRPVPKVLDFGISKLTWKTAQAHVLTRSGIAVGTPSYMSYEQLAGEHDIDRRADVYAFGVILYEVLTGRVPYEAETFPELLVRLFTRPPVPPKELRPELPGTLDRVVMWALERERTDRIASLDALIRELEPFATRKGFEAEQTRSEPSSSLRPGEAQAPTKPSDSRALASKAHTYTRTTVPGRRSKKAVFLLLLAAAIAVIALLIFVDDADKTTSAKAAHAPAAPASATRTGEHLDALAPSRDPDPRMERAPADHEVEHQPGRTPPGAAGPEARASHASPPPKAAAPAARTRPPAQTHPVRTHPAGPAPRDLGIY